jgi:hypothetical protein
VRPKIEEAMSAWLRDNDEPYRAHISAHHGSASKRSVRASSCYRISIGSFELSSLAGKFRFENLAHSEEEVKLAFMASIFGYR